jgi:hypothetical protein
MPPLNPGSARPAPFSAEDKVISTMPVFLSPELAAKMTVMSFPLQTANSESPLQLESVRLKKNNAIVEMDMAFPASDDHLDGEKVARWGDLEALTFKSTNVKSVCHYAVGKVVSTTNSKRELHLVPLDSNYQMRPTFPHIEREDVMNDETGEGAAKSQQQQMALNSANGVDNNEDNEEGGDGLRAIQYKKKESERTTTAKKSSYAFKRSEEAKEPWMDLEVQSNLTPHAIRYKAALQCKNKANKLEFKTTDYVAELNYLEELQEKKRMENDEQFDGAQEVISNPEQAVNKIIRSFYTRNAPINTAVMFSAVKSTSKQLLLDAMLTCAWSVRGNWVLKSKHCPFPRSLITARDVTLVLLIDKASFDKGLLKHVIADLKIADDALNHMLKEFAVMKGRHWKMRLNDDLEFGAEYPQVTAASDTGFEEVRARVADYVRNYDALLSEQGVVMVDM